MSLFEIFGAMLTIIALLGYLNYRFIRLPDTIGITAGGMLMSVILAGFGAYYPPAVEWARNLTDTINFSEVVFHGFLGVLLFAGSLHVNVADLRRQRVQIIVLATIGVLVSTAVVGFVMFYLLQFLGSPISLVHCLLFGALISPTDPIAVMGLLKSAGVSKELETSIVGESLFNDGTAVVAFIALLGLATGTQSVSFGGTLVMLVNELGGGLGLGALMGFICFFFIRRVDSYAVKILFTLAVATGGFALAERLHVSAPLAIVAAGLVLGNYGATRGLSAEAREHLFSFWDLLDEVLNLLLFGLIGLKLLSFTDIEVPWVPVALAVPVVLVARMVSVSLPLTVLRLRIPIAGHASRVLTWGGMRGGISIALVLSLPEFAGKPLLIMATYAVVLFSLLVQAPTLPWFLKRLPR